MDIQFDGDDKSIRIQGEVANANRFGSGIEFEEVSGDLLETLGNCLYKIR